MFVADDLFVTFTFGIMSGVKSLARKLMKLAIIAMYIVKFLIIRS